MPDERMVFPNVDAMAYNDREDGRECTTAAKRVSARPAWQRRRPQTYFGCNVTVVIALFRVRGGARRRLSSRKEAKPFFALRGQAAWDGPQR